MLHLNYSSWHNTSKHVKFQNDLKEYCLYEWKRITVTVIVFVLKIFKDFSQLSEWNFYKKIVWVSIKTFLLSLLIYLLCTEDFFLDYVVDFYTSLENFYTFSRIINYTFLENPCTKIYTFFENVHAFLRIFRLFSRMFTLFSRIFALLRVFFTTLSTYTLLSRIFTLFS